MRETLAAYLMVLFCATALPAADLGTPNLSPPIATARFFDPDRLLTTGGLKYSASDALTLEPELGLDYREQERNLAGGIEESTQQLHALAGGRISLAETVYLSAAAKLQVLTVESVGSITGQERGTRYGYDITHPFRSAVTWTGQVGLRLSQQTDLSLYYDQSPVTGWLPGARQLEERVGTRIIWKFW
jgi:hypothetical protein